MENLKNKLSNRIIIILSVLFLLSISLSTVNAAENTTDLGATITGADNDDIIHLDGTYKTNVTNILIDKNITLIGKDPKTTIIDADNNGRIFNIQSNGTLTLINITIINGNAEGGGAIYNYGKLTMANCILTNNIDNLYYGGGAIYNSEGSDVEINNCIFTDNFCTYGDGGAIYNEYGANLDINNSSFESNKANSYGGAIANHGIININNCNFTNNNAGFGAAIYNSGTMTINNSKFTNNKADRNGGAINNRRTMTITNTSFTKNSAANGGAIYNTGNQITIINYRFIDNTANYGGAIISIMEVSLFLSSLSRTINYDTYDVVIINSSFKDNAAEYGGAIYSSNNFKMLVENSNFTDNIADYDGGAIYNYGDDMLVFNCIFNNNTADEGSAIYNNYCYNLAISNSNFTNNKGGATITLWGIDTIITGCNIFNNAQGIIINEDSNATINYNRIFNNTKNTGFNLDDGGIGSDLDFNWWGNNNPKINGTINNYFLMNVTNLTSLDSNGTVTFNYTFKLNNSDSFDASSLPYFVTDVYTNLTDGVITSFDARFDRNFDVTVNASGAILYTFVTDNEIQTLDGVITLEEPDDNGTDEDESDDNNGTDKINNNSVAVSATMKETGIPINLIILVLLSLLGFGYYRKQ